MIFENPIKKLTITEGRFFVSGDIHGMFNMLYKGLESLNFDENKDVFATVGDLIDRGENSKEIENFLNKKNTYSTFGNHEELMVTAVLNPSEATASDWINNGGFWELGETNLKNLTQKCLELPIAIEVDFYGKKIGIVHSGVPHFINSWDFFLKKIDSGDTKVIENAIWGRVRALNKYSDPVEDIDFVVSGHTIVEDVICRENSLFIDTGAFYCSKEWGGVENNPNNGLTVIEFLIDEDGELVFDTYFFQY